MHWSQLHGTSATWMERSTLSQTRRSHLGKSGHRFRAEVGEDQPAELLHRVAL